MKKLLAFIAALAMSVTLASPLVLAVGPNETIDCSGEAASSSFCTGRIVTGNPLYGKGSVLAKAAQILTIITGIISMFILTIAGLRFVRSSGDPQKLTDARNAILYAVIGLVVAISGQAIISLVLNKL